MARYWYAYSSGDNDNPNSYSRTPMNPATFCNGGPTPCAIRAVPNSFDNNKPIMTNRLIGYISTATSLGIPYPAWPAKSYVYVKT